MKKLSEKRVFEISCDPISATPEEIYALTEELTHLRAGSFVARGYQINQLQNSLCSLRRRMGQTTWQNRILIESIRRGVSLDAASRDLNFKTNTDQIWIALDMIKNKLKPKEKAIA